MQLFLHWLDYLAVVGIGWGVGVSGWVAAGHQACKCLFLNTPSSWTLWRQDVLTSPWPLFKYVFGGILLLVLGVVAGRELVSLWSSPFQTGVWAGGVTGVFWSLRRLSEGASQVDFLLSNRRYVDERRVGFSSNDEK